MKIRIYTSKECHYCDELKEKLEKLEIVFTDVDVDDEKNEVEISKLFQFAGEPVIPIIIIKPHMLIPKRSFTTIDQAILLIQTKIEGLKEK
jgi:glutaredoxin